MTSNANARALPDVADENLAAGRGRLHWVGMAGIEAAVLQTNANGPVSLQPAQVDAYVDLDRPEQRGIHMSRLYLLVDKQLSQAVLTPARLRDLLLAMLESQAGSSTQAKLRIRYRHLMRRAALASDNSGWRSYPVTVSAQACNGATSVELAFEVTYSSTCPASAALARRLIQDEFDARFGDADSSDHDAVHQWLGDGGIVATPHSQRSTMQVRVKLADDGEFPLVELIDSVEAALATPVQTAVKRIDEQAFALRNGQNLMFCEDAARRVQAALDGDARISDFWLRASHHESLHPHDAVAMASKGVVGGYGPDFD
ncbi:MAG: GTP cyclohydrolase FolE2 [Dokdonella sp.]